MALYINGIKFDELTSDPGSPEEGQMWYNTTDKAYRLYTDTTVKEVIYRHEFTTHTGSLLNPHEVTATQIGLGSVTNDAQLLRSANDFNTFTEKTTISGGDIILIEDSEAAGVKKYVQLSNLLATPSAHNTTHEDGGPDEINVTGLSGLLADPQTPTTHSGTHVVGGSDIIDGDKLEVSWTGYSNYTPTDSPFEVDGTNELTAHLAGIDALLGTVSGSNVTQNGFENRVDSVLSFVDGTRTLTITPVGASFGFYAGDTAYTKTTAQSTIIPDTEGIHFIYFDESGVLQSQMAFSDALITTYAYTAVVYWDATNNVGIVVGDERHGREMDAATHLWAHNTFGTRYDSGLAVGDITADASGDNAIDAQVSVSNGIIRDEDIVLSIQDGSPQTLATTAEIPLFHRSGASGDWRKIAATTYPVTNTGSGRAAWNEYTGATWQLTEVPDTEFVLTHIFATNDINEPIVGIVGQTTYSGVAAARTGAITEAANLSLGAMQYLAVEFKAIGTVIFQTDDTYLNAVQSRVVSTDEGDDYIDLRFTGFSSSGSGATTSDHGSLAGLGDDDHVQYHNDARGDVRYLDRFANDFNTFSQKVTVSGTDRVLIEDSADSGNKKYINVDSLVATPGAHVASHQDGGGDELDVTGLSGLLADPQTPTTHSGTHVRGGSDAIDGDLLEVSWTGYTNYTPSTTPGEVSNTDELTAHLAGIDAKLGSASELRQKAGRVLAGTFAGNPKTATVTFATAMPDTNYGVVLTATSNASNKSFNVTAFTKTTAGFSITTGTNNVTNLVEVSWVATADGETA